MSAVTPRRRAARNPVRAQRVPRCRNVEIAHDTDAHANALTLP